MLLPMVKVRVAGQRKPPVKVVVKPTAKPTLASLTARIDALEARLARIEAPPAIASPGSAGARSTAAAVRSTIDLAAIKQAALETVAELDVRGRLGGLVPIPDLRAALRAQAISDDAAVTAALEQLEQEWKIDLNVAQSPTAVSDRAAGIERAGRGLLYYVSRRSP
jgi:hypothetical protein